MVQFGLLRIGDLRLFLILQKIRCYSTSLERFFFSGGSEAGKRNAKAIAKQQNGGSPSMFAKKIATKFNDVEVEVPFEFFARMCFS